MSENKTKVIYIAGATRSGSTLLSNILGEVGGFFNGGELIEFWDRGRIWSCSCGSKVENCEIWKKIIDKIISGRGQADIESIINMRDLYVHTKNVPPALMMHKVASKQKERLKYYIDSISSLYETIRLETQSRVIIDASKNVGYAHVLESAPSIDLFLIHLIRDARATAYSWLQKKGELWVAAPGATSLVWSTRNIVTEMLGKKMKKRYLRIHYEEFIQRPKEQIRDILNLLGENSSHLPFIKDKTVTFGINHGLCGNPDRFNRGAVVLKLDQKWARMKQLDYLLVTFLTIPLLLRYKYHLRLCP